MGWFDKTETKKKPYISPSERRAQAEADRIAALPSAVAKGILTMEELEILHSEALEYNKFLDHWDNAFEIDEVYNDWRERKGLFEDIFGHFLIGDKISYFGFHGYIVEIYEPKFNPAVPIVYTHRSFDYDVYNNAFEIDEADETRYKPEYKDYQVKITYKNANDEVTSAFLDHNECYMIEDI